MALRRTSFVNAIREDTEKKGLLFAGTELGVYVSFDDGDHWQRLQLNLPATSVRDITIHGDDLAIATYGRSFWILDDITLLRQVNPQAAAGAQLYKPATAIRVDNDVFLGSPLPPEEPVARNPPDGAIVDYYLPAAAKSVTLEIFDSSGKLMRRYVGGAMKEQPHPPMAIAERWLPKPVVLEKTAGAHRFIWDLRWGTSGPNPETEDEEGFGAPRGPRATAGKLPGEADGGWQRSDAAVKSGDGPARAGDSRRVGGAASSGAGVFRRGAEQPQGAGGNRCREEAAGRN